MKKYLITISFIFLSLYFASPALSVTYTNFYATLPQAGWAGREATLNLRIAPIACSQAGVCMVNGFGFTSDYPQSIFNFEGNALNDGTYIHVWLKGDGRGVIGSNTYFVNYDIYMKINLSNPSYESNTFHSKVTSNDGQNAYVSQGHVTITFY